MSTVRNPFQHFVNFIEMRKILSQTPTTTHLSRSFFFDLKFSFHTIIYKFASNLASKFELKFNRLKHLNKFKIMLSEHFFDELLVVFTLGFERDRDISVAVLQASREAVVVDLYDIGASDL